MQRLILAIALCFCHAQETSFRVLTMNIWSSGQHINDAIRKIVTHVQNVNPHIVLIQEAHNHDFFNGIVETLGEDWYSIVHEQGDTAIISQFVMQHDPKNDLFEAALRAVVEIDNQTSIVVYNVHLNPTIYGPYFACNKLIQNVSQLLEVDYKSATSESGRVIQIQTVLQSLQDFDNSTNVIIGGDFNSPSHLDWIAETAHTHCDWEVPWHVTSLLEQAGFTDTYRFKQPNALKDPGLTWSATRKQWDAFDSVLPEPQDRIDMIFTRGRLQTSNAFVYGGTDNIFAAPNEADNDWPSDHYALVVDLMKEN